MRNTRKVLNFSAIMSTTLYGVSAFHFLFYQKTLRCPLKFRTSSTGPRVGLFRLAIYFATNNIGNNFFKKVPYGSGDYRVTRATLCATSTRQPVLPVELPREQSSSHHFHPPPNAHLHIQYGNSKMVSYVLSGLSTRQFLGQSRPGKVSLDGEDQRITLFYLI